MPSSEQSQSPSPRRGGGIFVLILLLVAGAVAARFWIGAQRNLPTASTAAWQLVVSEPSGTVIHQPTTFEVEIRQPDGKPVEGAEVEFDLTMPDMEMPLNRFAAPAVAGRPGWYRGEGTFTMKGKWQIEAIARQGGSVATARRIVPEVR